MTFQTSSPERASATLIACVSDAERAAIQRLTQAHDRTVSREVRRTIRMYLRNPQAADRVPDPHCETAQDTDSETQTVTPYVEER